MHDIAIEEDAMSEHLDNIIKKHEGVADLKVVFVDVEKYSKRRTKIQNQVIDKLSSFLKTALLEVSKQYTEYTQNNHLNLNEDSILLPTGDGAGVVFSYDGLEEIHLDYAKALLRMVFQYNSEGACTSFAENGYCNDHAFFNVRIGISSGRGLIYRDVNDRFNVAGDVINMAARVMNLADRNQIVFTDEAHRKIIDLVDKLAPDDQFMRYPQVRLKHDVVMDVYQYLGEGVVVNPKPLDVGRLLDPYSVERMQLQRFSELEKEGFRKLYPNRQDFFNELFGTILGSVTCELKIMGICISLFRESEKPSRTEEWTSASTCKALVDTIERGCSVKVLFLKRYLEDSERKHFGIMQKGDLYYMRERDEETDYDFRFGKRLKIIANLSVGHFISVLVQLARRAQDASVDTRREVLSHLQLREYIALPAVSLYIADNDLYVTPYLYKRHCSTVPAFKASGRQSTLFNAYNGNFDAIWKDSESSQIIDPRFIKLLEDDPKPTLELYDKRYKELAKQAHAAQKDPKSQGDPDQYRSEEKAISEVITSIRP